MDHLKTITSDQIYIRSTYQQSTINNHGDNNNSRLPFMAALSRSETWDVSNSTIVRRVEKICSQ